MRPFTTAEDQDQQLDSFAKMIKKQSNKKSANELINLKPIHFKHYLDSVKDLKKTSTSKQDLMNNYFPEPIQKPKRDQSHYYLKRRQLLTLKEFNLLVSNSQKKLAWQNHLQQRYEQKEKIKKIEEKIQSGVRQKLRLTSAFVKRMQKFI